MMCKGARGGDGGGVEIKDFTWASSGGERGKFFEGDGAGGVGDLI